MSYNDDIAECKRRTEAWKAQYEPDDEDSARAWVIPYTLLAIVIGVIAVGVYLWR